MNNQLDTGFLIPIDDDDELREQSFNVGDLVESGARNAYIEEEEDSTGVGNNDEEEAVEEGDEEEAEVSTGVSNNDEEEALKRVLLCVILVLGTMLAEMEI